MTEKPDSTPFHISNHYRCQNCFSEEYLLKPFKNLNGKWTECEENEAEIALEYYNECHCHERVHESHFFDTPRLKIRRPYTYRFWRRVSYGWKVDDESIQLYNEVFRKKI